MQSAQPAEDTAIFAAVDNPEAEASAPSDLMKPMNCKTLRTRLRQKVLEEKNRKYILCILSKSQNSGLIFAVSIIDFIPSRKYNKRNIDNYMNHYRSAEAGKVG